MLFSGELLYMIAGKKPVTEEVHAKSSLIDAIGNERR
jgi:hypothetical protein